MKHFDAGIVVTLVVLVFCAIAAFVSVQITGKHDQPIEQAAEEILKDTTGISIDFTPEDDNNAK